MTQNGVLSALLIVSLLFSLVGCGRSKDEVTEIVKSYQIFDEEYKGCRSVYDFNQYLESLNNDEDGEAVWTTVSSWFNAEPFKDDYADDFIEALQDTPGFSYDEEKDYVRMYVEFSHYLVHEDEMVKGKYSCILSVDDNDVVTPEAWGRATDDVYEADDIELNSSYPVSLSMGSLDLFINMTKSYLMN